MSVNEKMTAIADAIRGKTGDTGPLNLDQMAMEIAAIEVGGGSDTDGYTAKIRASNSTGMSLSGYWTGLKNIEIDMRNLDRQIPLISYFGTDKVGGTCTFKNIANHTMPGDLFRQGNVFSTVSFEPYIAPTSLTRFCYQASIGIVPSGSTYVPPNTITIRGLRLDKLTSTSNPFYDAGSTSFHVLWEGTLNNSVSFNLATTLTDESLALLLECLADYSASSDSHTLTLGTTLLARLTDAQIAAATEKGWNLA